MRQKVSSKNLEVMYHVGIELRRRLEVLTKSFGSDQFKIGEVSRDLNFTKTNL